MSLSAIVISHGHPEDVKKMIDLLNAQTRPPDEIIATVCCMSVDDLKVDIALRDIHREDIGQSKCDFGINLATKEYVGFFSSDDGYASNYIERMLQESADLIYCGFRSHLAGTIMTATPVVGRITRGCYFVRTSVAKRVGYKHWTYEGDGLFVQDLVSQGVSQASIPEILHYHN